MICSDGNNSVRRFAWLGMVVCGCRIIDVQAYKKDYDNERSTCLGELLNKVGTENCIPEIVHGFNIVYTWILAEQIGDT